MFQAKRAGPPHARHLGTQSWENVSGEVGQTTSRAAPRSPDFRGCLKRKGLDRLRSRHLGAQSWEDVSGAIGQTTSGQGISEPRVARASQVRLAGPLRSRISEPKVWRMSQAKLARPPQIRAPLSPELRGCLRRKGPDHFRSRHLIAQSWEDVSSAIGQTIPVQGISGPRAARASQARLAGPLRSWYLLA